MRLIFLLPGIRRSTASQFITPYVVRFRGTTLGRWAMNRHLYTHQVSGGMLNVFRHAQIASQLGVPVVIASVCGQDTYQNVFGDQRRFQFIRWRDRRPTDVCVVPDFATQLIDQVAGPVVAYQQSPLFLQDDFDWRRASVRIWTDSPVMQSKCEALYKSKPITIAPNVVDSQMFPFLSQQERTPGLIFAFPRKGPAFIEQTQAAYRSFGGRYWRFELIDGLSIAELAKRFREPQAFLASADVEGCALPPQEAMAAGVVVVGKKAHNCNFSMQDGVTALVGETPEAAARRLIELESAQLRDTLSKAGYAYISRFFAAAEPTLFWKSQLAELGFSGSLGQSSQDQTASSRADSQ